MELGFKFYSKADTLKMLKEHANCCRIEDVFSFTVGQWQKDAGTLCSQIINGTSTSHLVVRSSSVYEEGVTASQAGCFHSELGVKLSEKDISEAVKKVIDSYGKGGQSNDSNQILVQPQTEDIVTSGVVFTRQIETNAPYYVINYDDQSGKSDMVTSGCAGDIVYISRFNTGSLPGRWAKLITAVKEIEALSKDTVLDIEFAITNNGDVVIFQVRTLAANHNVDIPDDEFTKNLLEDMASKFRRLSQPVPHLAGRSIIFGDMPDWNPSEIIGSRPNTLDYTIYSFIITDEIWHQARTSLGYYNVYPAELMVSFGKKPYIDTRASFNSFTPVDISDALREKLINYYLGKLRGNPQLQDKVEFDILWTCYDFSTAKELEELKKYGFSMEEVETLKASLLNLTCGILNESNNITSQDLGQVQLLTQRRDKVIQFYQNHEESPWNILYAAYNILQNCKKFGTLPFSRQARLGFIAKSFLISMRDQGIITSNFYSEFLNSIRTVASNFNDDFVQLQSGQLSKDIFIKRYGHLRAGTYDITAYRYDRAEHLFENNNEAVYRRSDDDFVVSDDVKLKINRALDNEGISFDADQLLYYIQQAIENREYAKFEFTKSLSDAIEMIAQAGEMLGFTRSQLSHCDLDTIMKFRNPEHGDEAYAKKIFQQSIDRHKKERHWYDAVILGPVIAAEEDFYYVAPYKAMPNFITQKSVSGEVVTFDKVKEGKDSILKDKVVLLENADPGFDWIFTKKPLGIITKYGGVASHMSIRCAEFNIAAAIGAGTIYDNLKGSEVVRLDCAKKTIKPLRKL